MCLTPLWEHFLPDTLCLLEAAGPAISLHQWPLLHGLLSEGSLCFAAAGWIWVFFLLW